MHYNCVDVEADAEGLAFIEPVQQRRPHRPDDHVRRRATSWSSRPTPNWRAKLGSQTRAKRSFYDLIIIGGGPAGLMAAIYARARGHGRLIIERAGLGGQAGVTERLDNFPGFPEGIGGAEFADRLAQQAAPLRRRDPDRPGVSRPSSRTTATATCTPPTATSTARTRC